MEAVLLQSQGFRNLLVRFAELFLALLTASQMDSDWYLVPILNLNQATFLALSWALANHPLSVLRSQGHFLQWVRSEFLPSELIEVKTCKSFTVTNLDSGKRGVLVYNVDSSFMSFTFYDQQLRSSRIILRWHGARFFQSTNNLKSSIEISKIEFYNLFKELLN
jgi:hypothetical protein